MSNFAALIQLNASELETLWTSPRFFAAIFAGLVIAVAVQLLLTNLSVAIGVTAVGDLDDPPSGDSESSGSATSQPAKTVRRINHAFGIWALLSGSLSVLAGAWLGVELSLTVDPLAGAVIGLVIWGLFYFAMLFVEASIVGTLARSAAHGVRSVSSGLSSALSGSQQPSPADTAADVARAVRDELMDDRSLRQLGSRLRDTVERFEQKSDPKYLRQELETLIGRTEFEASVEAKESSARDQTDVTASLKTRPGPSKTTTKKVGEFVENAHSAITEEASSDKGPVDSAISAGMRAAGLSTEEATRYRAKLEEYLRSTDSEALDPDRIKQDLRALLDDPRRGWEALKTRFQGIDRDSIKGLMTSRGVAEGRAEKITAWAESALEKLSRERGTRGNQVGDDRNRPSLSDRANDRLRRYLGKVDDPRLDYDRLRGEVELLLDDPEAGSDALLRRLKSLDRDTIQSILAARQGVDEKRADEMIRTVEQARDRVIERAREAQALLRARMDEARTTTMHAAEETRQFVSVAAWWAAAGSTASAIAGAIGGVIAVSTGIGG